MEHEVSDESVLVQFVRVFGGLVGPFDQHRSTCPVCGAVAQLVSAWNDPLTDVREHLAGVLAVVGDAATGTLVDPRDRGKQCLTVPLPVVWQLAVIRHVRPRNDEIRARYGWVDRFYQVAEFRFGHDFTDLVTHVIRMTARATLDN